MKIMKAEDVGEYSTNAVKERLLIHTYFKL